ncbi:hypothetical protein GPALN_002125 [Globodera pallida]|uniref:Aa_trans domain-containing protein n=1 Tax=Globodera pallida TaxID=36090 RepID=A0A183C3D2_GLOPA|nr:hypothetical protein GPALN_002125 [Globodera pallida]
MFLLHHQLLLLLPMFALCIAATDGEVDRNGTSINNGTEADQVMHGIIFSDKTCDLATARCFFLLKMMGREGTNTSEDCAEIEKMIVSAQKKPPSTFVVLISLLGGVFIIFVPPIAILLKSGECNQHVLISVVLCCILLWIPAVIHAVWYCFIR